MVVALAGAIIVSWVGLSAQSAPIILRGTVVDDDGGEPIVNARVAPETAAVGADVVLTDESGRFSIAIAAGSSATITKTGFGRATVPAPSGGTPLVVRLQRGAAVSGRVVATSGEPIVGALVQARVASMPADARPLATSSTDDHGDYRIAGLPADSYIVSTTTLGTPTTSRMPNGNVTVRSTVIETFYPGTLERKDAGAIRLGAGDDVPRIDFVTDPGPPFALPFSPLAQPPAPAPGQTATATIRGFVLDEALRGIPRALVGLSVANSPIQQLTTTADSSGRFEFRDLPGGRFFLMAGKTGFSFMFQQKLVAVAEGQTVDRADLSLTRLGSIGGRIVDERGDPIQGAIVQALHVRYEGGHRRLVPAGGGRRTDDLGRYRLFDLMPGSYVISAGVSDVQSAGIPGYGRSYYPGTTIAGQAQFVSLRAGQDVPAIDFGLARARTARIDGRMLNAAGEPTMAGSLTLRPASQSASTPSVSVGARIEPDGRFEFSNVAPGQYVITSSKGRSNRWTEGEFGTLAVSVDGTNITGLTLQTSRGSAVKGRFVFDTRDRSTVPAPERFDLSPVPVDFDLAPTAYASAEVHDDWTFDLAGLTGPRRLQLTRAPAGWMLQSIRINGVDATDRVVTFGRADQSLSDVDVIVSDRVSTLEGTIPSGERAAPPVVVAFATDPSRWYFRSRFLRAAAPGPDGAFRIDGLPFGTYYVVALSRLPDEGDDAWQDPDFLEALARRTSTVTVRDGETITIKLDQVLGLSAK